MTTPLERDIAAAESRGDLDHVDELNAQKLANLLASADGNGHVQPPELPPGIPPQDPSTGDWPPEYKRPRRLSPFAYDRWPH